MIAKAAVAVSSIVLVATSLLPGCGGSDSTPPDGGGGGTQLPIIYNPGDSSPNSNSITLQLVSSTRSSVTLEAVATDVTNLATVAFDLVFTPSVISYRSATPGSLFSGGGNLQFLAQPDMTGSGDGRLVVGIAFVPDTTSVSGTGTIATFTFDRVASGTSAMSFEATGAFHPGRVAAGTRFTGGTVRVP